MWCDEKTFEDLLTSFWCSIFSNKIQFGNDEQFEKHNKLRNNHESPTQILKVKVTEDPQICDRLLKSQSYLNKSDFRIQLIAATPGSGSDWCRTTISLLTGNTHVSKKIYKII